MNFYQQIIIKGHCSSSMSVEINRTKIKLIIIDLYVYSRIGTNNA